jgi:membrane-bound metal-dependent hydrolase YbcI (DUF457 family)
MMGRSHSLSGTTAWSAVIALAPTLAHARLGTPELVAGLLSTAGAALLPDLDHPGGTIANSFGPVSRAVARIVNRVSGGHREATHSMLFAALAFSASSTAIRYGHAGAGLAVLFLLYAFGFRALRMPRGIVIATAAAATVGAGFALHGDYGWLPYSVGAGVLTHLAGDCLTRQGCPLLWPIPARFRIPVIQRTGNAVENWAFAPAFALGTAALLAPQVWTSLHVAH